MSFDCTCSALRKAARRLTQAYDAALAPEGLNTPQYALLSRLDASRDKPPTVQHLADLMSLDRTTLAHNLRPLQRDGLLVVAEDRRDRRIRRVVLTATGRCKREACRPLWEAAQRRFGEAFGAERATILHDALRAIHDLYPPSALSAPNPDHHDAG